MATEVFSQKTSAELVIYSRNVGTVTSKPTGDAQIRISNDPFAGKIHLTALDTEKTMGAAGNWTATLKVPRSMVAEWEESIEDGDWVDITLQRGSRRYHTMRGIIDAVDPIYGVSGEGADTLVYQLTGWDHQAVWEQSPLWFNSYSQENIYGAATLRANLITGSLIGLGSVRETTTGLLFGFIKQMLDAGRDLWTLPAGMPAGGGLAFAVACARSFNSNVDDPARLATGISMMAGNQTSLWQLAAEWCDPQFNEFWCDLTRGTGKDPTLAGDVSTFLDTALDLGPYQLHETDALEADQTQMTIFLRRRPFPTSEATDPITAGDWSRLPTAIILPQELMGLPLSRSGAERINLIEVYPATIQEVAPTISLLAPLVDKEDVRYRGVRQLAMKSRYHGDANQGMNDADMAESQRRMLRDWHCLNPRFLSGRLPLRTFRPGIRVGTVATVSRNPNLSRGSESNDDMNFYVESVRNSWRAPGNGRTELGVTRGFRGGDAAMYRALSKAQARFSTLEPASSLLSGNGKLSGGLV